MAKAYVVKLDIDTKEECFCEIIPFESVERAHQFIENIRHTLKKDTNVDILEIVDFYNACDCLLNEDNIWPNTENLNKTFKTLGEIFDK